MGHREHWGRIYCRAAPGCLTDCQKTARAPGSFRYKTLLSSAQPPCLSRKGLNAGRYCTFKT